MHSHELLLVIIFYYFAASSFGFVGRSHVHVVDLSAKNFDFFCNE